jgi:D-alanyl-lipoteichoic acid acyltransferase DltB (MBOAT superfamily)
MAAFLARNGLKMDFISIEYAFFFSCVVFVYFLLPQTFRPAWLVICSIYFYSVFDPWFIMNLMAASLLVYFGAFFIERGESKAIKRSRFMSILLMLIFNFLTLRHFSFLSESFQSLFFQQEVKNVPPRPNLIPIGLSFYTFLLIGYLIDVLRGTPAERKFISFFLFVSFFPKIVAGPIERTNNLLQQIRKLPAFDYALAVLGLQLILLGLFKKIMVADRLAPFVENIYGNPYAADGPMLFAATVTYAFQLYFDFSGYSDIAIGCVAVLGFRLIGNFRQPYFATSIGDFWKRWHISLTSWLTEYVYNPIVRQRRLKIKLFNLILIAIFTTFLISGIWHGAQWTFVLWGCLHGLYMIISILSQKLRVDLVRKLGLHDRVRLHKLIKIFTTFMLVCLSYILFRANNVTDAIHIMSHLVSGWNDPISSLSRFVGAAKLSLLIGVTGVVILMIGEAIEERGQSVRAIFSQWPLHLRWGTYGLAVIALLVVGGGSENQTFIYFRF